MQVSLLFMINCDKIDYNLFCVLSVWSNVKRQLIAKTVGLSPAELP